MKPSHRAHVARFAVLLWPLACCGDVGHSPDTDDELPRDAASDAGLGVQDGSPQLDSSEAVDGGSRDGGDDDIVGSPTFRIGVDDGVRIGQRDYSGTRADWDEFTNSDVRPNFRVGESATGELRPWIGHSECPTCEPGIAKKQQFTFPNLEVGETYHLTLYPSHVKGTEEYRAAVAGGEATILRGDRKHFAGVEGYLSHSDQWVIEFTAHSPEVSLELGHGRTGGNHYLYVDFYVFAPERVRFVDVTAAEFSAMAMAKDTLADGDWYKSAVYNRDTQRYAWVQGYVMSNYVYLYRVTRERYWLDKLVDHADAVLAQRDQLHGRSDHRSQPAPVWQEQHHRFAWIGFTGALFAPMSEFARVVATDPDLGDYVDEARSYLDAFDLAVAYHESEWRNLDSNRGTYVFPSDLPASISRTLAGEQAAQNMVALMAGALLHAGKAHGAFNAQATETSYLEKVARYATYLRSRFRTASDGGREYYVWDYAPYSSRLEDLGHGNFVVRFVYECAQDEVVFSSSDLRRLAHTYERLIGPNYDITANVVDATVHPAVRQPNNSSYYWHFVAPFGDGLLDRANGRARQSGFPFFDFVVLPYVTQQQPP